MRIGIYFLIDEEGLFLQEWRDCTGGMSNIFVGDHIADLMQNNKILIERFNRDHILRKKMRALGVPSKDVRIVEFASGAGIYLILTHDIDLFEPKMKVCSPKK